LLALHLIDRSGHRLPHALLASVAVVAVFLLFVLRVRCEETQVRRIVVLPVAAA